MVQLPSLLIVPTVTFCETRSTDEQLTRLSDVAESIAVLRINDEQLNIEHTLAHRDDIRNFIEEAGVFILAEYLEERDSAL